jgi:hypothetical protein
MADLINLNRYRKERQREAAAKTAEENRARFGRTKGERGKSRREAEKSTKDHDGKRID